MRGLLAAPLVHFLCLGALLAGGRAWWARDEAAARPRIVLGADEIARLREAWKADHDRPPDDATLVREAVDDEVLYREALAAGFDRGDAAVRERLVRLGGVVGEETAGDRAALEREARRLGLERSDVVIRRHLVEMMRLALERAAPGDVPTDAELADWLARHANELAEPATVSFTHVYFSADARGPSVARDAAAALAALRGGATGVPGDAFIRGADIGPATRDDVERGFGPGFARALEAAPAGAWVGPVESPYGL